MRGAEQPGTHLLLQPLLLPLDPLLQSPTEPLHLLAVLGHAPAGDSEAKGWAMRP